uniref:C3H1-type domain-containing protein n=1 Tax=Ascaris lumbricoides TaxID=6252 RepID=A0A0M3I3Y0_ASCLU
MTDNTTISKEVDVGDSQIEKSTTSTERKPSKQFQMGHIREAQKAQEGTLNERKIVAVKSDDDAAPVDVTKKQQYRRRPRSGGMVAQQSSSRYEYRRFRRPPKIHSGLSTVADKNENACEKNPSASDGISIGSERNKPIESERNDDLSGSGDSTDAGKDSLVDAHTARSTPAKRRVCKYFAAEQVCYFGDRCRFLHVRDAKLELENLRPTHESTIPSTGKPTQPAPFRPQVLQLTKEQLGSSEQLTAFNAELSYFKRRFRDSVITKLEDKTTILFEYSITDPDWIFEVKSLRFSLVLPQGYPIDRGNIRVVDESLPKPLIIHIDKALDNYCIARWEVFESKNAFESVGKSLIRWIDRSIFDLFVVGLKKTKMIFEAESAGISLVLPSAPSNPLGESKEGEADERETSENKNDESLIIDENNGGVNEGNLSIEEFRDEIFTADREPSMTCENKTLIDVRVQWRDLSTNIASLSAASLALSTKCAKCGAPSFMTCSPNRVVAAACKRCSNRQSIFMQSALVHENSNVIAQLDPKGCRPVDCVLLSSSFRFVCLNCNREATAENLSYGVAHKTWCFSCHTKCEFDISAIRFAGNFHLIAKEDEMMQKIKIVKKKKPEQQIVIVEGEPLPDHGTCKHYRKSYRWLRFPCCGKLYPCDVCHDENERDHEMKFASRMVCGFCSKEQPFQKSKPCIRCSENVTRVRSSHWEGGKGCRDQTLMSRNDDRKYANSRMKTVSKKHVGQLVIKKKPTNEK